MYTKFCSTVEIFALLDLHFLNLPRHSCVEREKIKDIRIYLILNSSADNKSKGLK